MEGKFTGWQRIVLIITFLVIVISGAIRLMNHAVDPGAVIVLSRNEYEDIEEYLE